LPTRHLVTVVGEALNVSQRFESRAKLLFVGEVIEGKAQIIQGLSGGETVIVEGGYGITDGVEAHQAKGEKE
jgi:hypothetical protein